MPTSYTAAMAWGSSYSAVTKTRTDESCYRSGKHVTPTLNVSLTICHRHDFNDEIEGGTAFNDVDDWHTDTLAKWANYSTQAFEEQREPSVGEPLARGEKRRELALDDGGLPLIPPLDGDNAPSLAVMKSMIRDFLTIHYSTSPRTWS